MKIRFRLIIALLLFPFSSHGALKVVTTTQDLAAIAEAVGGETVQVQSLTAGTRDPHFASAKPSMIHQVSRAQLLLVVGADLEIGWLPALLRSARNGQIQPGNPGYLDLAGVVPLLGKVAGPVSRSMGDVHAKGNPHYWLDPRNGERMAKAIASRLSELDPEHKALYQQRYQAFAKTLDARLSSWRHALASLKNKPVIAYHKSFIYLADAFGFKIVDEVEPRPGIAPSAASLAALIKRIQQDKIGILIMEPYYERRSARYLNEHTGIRIAVLPQSVGALPGINNYFELFDRIVAVLTNQEGQ